MIYVWITTSLKGKGKTTMAVCVCSAGKLAFWKGMQMDNLCAAFCEASCNDNVNTLPLEKQLQVKVCTKCNHIAIGKTITSKSLYYVQEYDKQGCVTHIFIPRHVVTT